MKSPIGWDVQWNKCSASVGGLFNGEKEVCESIFFNFEAEELKEGRLSLRVREDGTEGRSYKMATAHHFSTDRESSGGEK